MPLQYVAAVRQHRCPEAQADSSVSRGGELMVLVFNLGGGTCDASLISLDAGILEVSRSCASKTAVVSKETRLRSRSGPN